MPEGLHPSSPLRTERLLLRPWRTADLEVYLRLRGDPDVARFLYDEPLDREGARARLDALSDAIDGPGEWLNLAVELAGTGEVVGDVGLCLTSAVHRGVEIGYTFLPAHHGHGYATEAAAAMVDLAVTALRAHRVSGRIDARNTASAAVLLRLGMRHEAHFVQNEWVKGEWTDESVYALLAEEWRSPGA